MRTLRSEFLKLRTVRSTYILSAVVIVLSALLSYFVFGKGSATPLDNPNFIYDSLYNLLGLIATFSAIIAILLVTHEYRYNTIVYTLTAAGSRLKVLCAKAGVLIGYVLTLGAVTLAVACTALYASAAVSGKDIVAQNIPYIDMLWRFGSYLIIYVLLGLALGLIIRLVVGAVVALFIVPTIAEPLLTLVLKDNSRYLPFRAIEQIVSGSSLGAAVTLSNVAALGVSLVYMTVLLSVAVLLFLRRDAN